ncbi:MAG: PEP-CTERM sorting domain-containing protein [Moraxellaceae bacterium]|nr:PEP-CTERM sorting domain-containing protein [Moraxellaceae bacterium]
MKHSVRAFVCTCSAAFALLQAAPSQAAWYHFSQGGFSGGGTITGTFDAEDLDGNGQISSWAGEVSTFTLSFSGDSVVGPFTHSFSDLFGLIYDLGSGFLGDGLDGDGEGIASNYQNAFGIEYISGQSFFLPYLGSVTDLATGAISTTDTLVSVTQVPEPGSLALALAGIALLATRARRKA